MSDHIRATIEELRSELRPMEEKIIKTKQLINMLCERAGMSPLYPEAELNVQSSGGSVTARGDEFFGKALNTSVKALFAQRKASGRGPATAEEIHDGLIAGGYEKFPSDREEALTGLRISLGKSSHTFVRLPNGSYGMADWYDIKRPNKVVASGKAEEVKPTETPTAESQERFKLEPEESEEQEAPT